ncbi:hypothetical protein ACFL0M_06235 [Thermodesulfobacteriota bacterium]
MKKFMPAIFTFYPGKAAMQIAAVQKSINHFFHIKVAKTHIDSHSGHPTALQVARNEIQHNENNGLPEV